MTGLHRTNEYLTFSKMMRPILAAALPLPCVDCKGTVLPGQLWDMGHIVALSQGGTNTASNVGVSHRHCNRSRGGAMGGKKTKAKHDRATGYPEL